MAKTKGIIVELGGDASGLQKAINSVSKEARDTQSELKKINRLLKMDPGNVTLLKQKQDLLNESISKTEEVIASFKSSKEKADADMANGTEINEKAYRELERQIEANEITLRETRKQAEAVADELNRIDSDELRDVERAAENAEDALEDAAKEAADFGDVLKAGMITEAAGQIVDSLKDVAEETREYRKIMGSLEVSSEQAGYSVAETSEAYKRLYGVLSDDQSAATTLANLQALELSQEDLLFLIDNVTGAWAKYGDSIPIDGLAEAVTETIRAGQVTGTFADIINWGAQEGETYGVKMREATEANKEWNQSVADAETAEDFFNLALQECTTEAERANLVMQAMADQGLSAMAQKWRENNESMVESNEAAAEMQDQLAQLGEKLEPLTTKLTNMVTKALEWFNSLDSGTQDFIIGTVLLIAALGPVFAAISGISAVVGGLATVFTTVMGFIIANPITLLIAGIAMIATVAISQADMIKAALQSVADFLMNVVYSVIDGINWLIDKINLVNGVASGSPGSFGTLGPIPMLASGGTVWSGSAIVGDAGPELLTVTGGKAVVQPLTTNTSKIEGLLGNISDQLIGSDYDIPFVVQVNLDGKVVGESAVQYIRRSDRGNGR